MFHAGHFEACKNQPIRSGKALSRRVFAILRARFLKPNTLAAENGKKVECPRGNGEK